MIGVVVVVLVAASTTPFWPFVRSSLFIRHWSQRFVDIDNLDSAKRSEKIEPVIVRAFPSGEWFIATSEHSCCGGARFNATVIRDSAGAIHTDTAHTFCGTEGLGEELGERLVPANSLAEFYAGIPWPQEGIKYKLN